MVLAHDVESAGLIQIIKAMQRHRFGRTEQALPGVRKAARSKKASEGAGIQSSIDQNVLPSNISSAGTTQKGA